MDASPKVFTHFKRSIMLDKFKHWLQSNLDYFMEEETEFVNYGDVAREAKNIRRVFGVNIGIRWKIILAIIVCCCIILAKDIR